RSESGQMRAAIIAATAGRRTRGDEAGFSEARLVVGFSAGFSVVLAARLMVGISAGLSVDYAAGTGPSLQRSPLQQHT
ncbi:hypothetical protein PENTCL1PPCAC_5123, partial [Pristionchus entomophagus]